MSMKTKTFFFFFKEKDKNTVYHSLGRGYPKYHCTRVAKIVTYRLFNYNSYERILNILHVLKYLSNNLLYFNIV